ncbi:hypothetical protein GCM10022245_45630 [Streptomyces mayteni]
MTNDTCEGLMQQAGTARTRPTRGRGTVFPRTRNLMQQVPEKGCGTFGKKAEFRLFSEWNRLDCGPCPGAHFPITEPGRAVGLSPLTDRPTFPPHASRRM